MFLEEKQVETEFWQVDRLDVLWEDVVEAVAEPLVLEEVWALEASGLPGASPPLWMTSADALVLLMPSAFRTDAPSPPMSGFKFCLVSRTGSSNLSNRSAPRGCPLNCCLESRALWWMSDRRSLLRWPMYFCSAGTYMSAAAQPPITDRTLLLEDQRR